MLSVQSFSGGASAAADAVKYLDHESPGAASADDYFNKESGDSIFYGSAAALEALGLSKNAEAGREARLALMLGRDPRTGEKLVKSGEKRRFGWDLTFSAPKSVSVLWGLGDEQTKSTLQNAHDAAVKTALAEAMKVLTARAGAGGAEKIENVEAMASLHRHGTSRALDPQLHTHAFVYNMALCEDGKWRTLETGDLYRHKMLIGAIYRAELAKQLKSAGYEIEADEKSFRIAGVSKEAEKMFSKRSEDIKKAVEEYGSFSAQAKAAATLATRPDKQETTPDLVKPLWQAQAQTLNEPLYEKTQPAAAAATYNRDEFLRDLTAQHSVFSELELKTALVTRFQHLGRGLDDAEAELAELKKTGGLVKLETRQTRGGDVFSTREQIEVEREMLELARAMRERDTHTHDSTPYICGFEREAGFSLSDEQRVAVTEMANRDLSVIRGVAGAGKTTAAEVAYKVYKDSGYEVIGLAIAGKAARGLKSASDRQQTIASFLIQAEKRPDIITTKTVLIIDEAGMIGSRTMHALLKRAHDAGAKVILIGDEKQLQPIESGGAFAAIQEFAVPDRAEISAIRRQKNEAARAVAEDFSKGDVRAAFQKMEAAGIVSYENDKKAAIEQVVDAFMKNKAEGVELSENLMLAALKRDVRALNDITRERLGLAGQGVEIVTEYGKREFAVGDRIIFKKNARGDEILTNGDLGTVSRIFYENDVPHLEIVRDVDKKAVVINTADYSYLEYGYAITTHAAQGVTVDRAAVLMDADTPLSSAELAYVQVSRQRGDSERAGLVVVGCADEEDINKVPARVLAAHEHFKGKATTAHYINRTNREAEV